MGIVAPQTPARQGLARQGASPGISVMDEAPAAHSAEDNVWIYRYVRGLTLVFGGQVFTKR